MASLPEELYQASFLDFVEITPETLCRQRPTASGVAIDLVPDSVARGRDVCGALPMVIHGVELSIGSVHGWNAAYLEMLDEFQRRWPFVWHSEHLGFQTMAGEGGESLEIGVPLPLPPTTEAAGIVAERSAAIRRRYGVPFLLENPAHYLPAMPADEEIGDEMGLMRAITESSGCFQLLDLHNIHCNAVNHRCDPRALIDRMPLDRVVEIHVAGGSAHDGFWMDAHDGRVPEPVWELLAYTLPHTPNIAGVVFELLEEHVPRAVEEEVLRAREIWNRHWGD